MRPQSFVTSSLLRPNILISTPKFKSRTVKTGRFFSFGVVRDTNKFLTLKKQHAKKYYTGTRTCNSLERNKERKMDIKVGTGASRKICITRSCLYKAQEYIQKISLLRVLQPDTDMDQNLLYSFCNQ